MSCRCRMRAASETCKCEDRNQGWARPSRSNCSDHSAGASRKLATPMPRCQRLRLSANGRRAYIDADIAVLSPTEPLQLLPERYSAGESSPDAITVVLAWSGTTHRIGLCERAFSRSPPFMAWCPAPTIKVRTNASYVDRTDRECKA